jgi:hypothetical protein
MLFYKNAWINKVKNIYPFWLPGGAKYARLNDGSGWIWDTDCGIKGTFLSSDLNAYVWIHMRVYAPNPPDYMYNAGWRKYVLGTTHFDQFPFEDWSGYSEWAEEGLASLARSTGLFVVEDCLNFYNYELYRNENNHIWLNNGYTTVVKVP